jgi:hypothetical protein
MPGKLTLDLPRLKAHGKSIFECMAKGHPKGDNLRPGAVTEIAVNCFSGRKLLRVLQQ